MTLSCLTSTGWRWCSLLIAALLLFGLVPLSDPAMASQPSEGQQFPAEVPPTGKVIVVMKPGRANLTGQVAAQSGVRPGNVYTAAIQGFSAPVDETSLEALRNNPNVAYISAVYPVVAAQSPATSISRSALDTNPTADIDGNPTLVDADIAVLDSGVEPHPDLNVVGGRDCTSGNPNAWRPNSSGDDHGTHVAGVAAARDNSFGVVGSAPGARVWSVQVLVNGSGDTSNIICGLDWVLSNAGTIDVVNMSISSAGVYPSSSCGGNDALHNAVCSTYNAGVPMFGAAGNFGANADTRFPGVMDEIMAVGAITDSNGEPGGGGAGLSCAGSSDADDSFAGYSNYGSRVEIVAPGTRIRSTINNGGYGYKCGTSMAAPLVAGVAAHYKGLNPGASAGATYQWVLRENSTSAGSPAGYSGASYPLLWATSYVSPSPGTRNPSFTGKSLTIRSSFGSGYTSGSWRVWDNNQGTSWYTTSGYPQGGYVQLDLGGNRKLTGIKWQFRLPNGADDMRVSVAQQGGTFTQLGTFTDGYYQNTWYGTGTNKTARYIRFEFDNPLNREQIGYLSEVEVWGGIYHSPGDRNPNFSGGDLPIRGSFGSGYTSGSWRVWDNRQDTSWYTTSRYPNGGYVQLDLGRNRDLSGIKWQFRISDAADQFRVRVAMEGGYFVTLGTFSDGYYRNTWYGVATSKTARYVRIEFDNPNGLRTLGYMSEVEVWGPGGQRVFNSAAATEPTFEGERVEIQDSWGSRNGSGSGRAWDENRSTSWYTVDTDPDDGQFVLDLGEERDLTGIRWMYRELGDADAMTVETRAEDGSWQSVGTFGNGDTTSTWYGQETTNTARYVRFSFANPNADSRLGVISEVEVWAQPEPEFRAASVTEATPEPEATPGTPVATPTVQGTPEPDATPVAEGTPVVDETPELEATPVTEGTPEFEATPIVEGTPESEATPIVEVTPESEVIPSAEGTPEPDATPGVEVMPADLAPEVDEPSVPEATPDVDGTPEPAGVGPASAGTPVVDEPAGETPTAPVEATTTPTAVPSPTAVPTATATVTPSPTIEPTATPTEEPAPTEAPATAIATVQGTGGTGLTCRAAPSTDAVELGLFAEGEQVTVLGDVQDGWLPVQCPTGDAGYASVDFLAIGDVSIPDATDTPVSTATASPDEGAGISGVPEPTATATVPSEADLAPTATESATVTPTAEPTLPPTPTPTPTPTEPPTIDIVSIADSEGSASALQAVDGDPDTYWLVQPVEAPREVRLRLDLGAVQPVGTVQWEMATAGTLPTFEIWLSVDGETWWQTNRINGFTLEPGVTYEETLNLQARYVRFVVPDADETGLAQIGGISEIRILPSDGAQSLDVLGAPVTPTPLPPTPTFEPTPTLEPTEPPVETVPPADEETEPDPPLQTVPPDEPIEEEESDEPVEAPVTEPTEPSGAPEPGDQSGE